MPNNYWIGLGKWLGMVGGFWQQKWVWRLLVLDLLLIIWQLILIAIYYQQMPSQIPFWMVHQWGEGRLAPAGFLFLYPGVGLIFTVINNGLAATVVKKNNIDTKVLPVVALIINLLSGWAVVNTIWLLQ